MTRKIYYITREENAVKPADFETAISATGYGKYNFFLLLICLPAGWATIFETTTMSYVFPAAQCDLNLSLNDKGLLNAVTYLGTISSALIWGFLFDTLGRKKLLMIGYLTDAIFVVASSLSQDKIFLMVAKFFGGFIINGPFAAFTAYLSEFQCAKYRARTQLMLGATFNFGAIVLPALAWAVIPQNLDFSFFSLEMHAWSVYLMICSFPAIISGILFIFLPESPKFLMTIGQNDKALKVFQRVYSVNTGKPMETYPIKELVDEIKLKEQQSHRHGGHITENRTKIQALKEGWQQMTPLFFPPFLSNLILVVLLQTLITMSLNTLRLWFPQIFQAINDFQHYNNGSTSDLCEMLDLIQPKNLTGDCLVNLENSSVYINSMTVASVTVCSYLFAGYLVNILGKKKLLSFLTLLSGSSCIAMYFTSNTIETLASAAIFNATSSIATNVVLTVIIDLFPTSLRTMTVSLAMMFARGGAMIGNLVFPLLLEIGCAPPFFSIGILIISCALISVLLPNTDMKALE